MLNTYVQSRRWITTQTEVQLDFSLNETLLLQLLPRADVAIDYLDLILCIFLQNDFSRKSRDGYSTPSYPFLDSLFAQAFQT